MAGQCGECGEAEEDEDATPPAPSAAPRWLHEDGAFGQVTLVGLGCLRLEALERTLASIFFEPVRQAASRALTTSR